MVINLTQLNQKIQFFYKCPTCPEGVPFDNENDCPLPYDTSLSPIGNQYLPKFIHEAHGPSVNGDLLIIDLTTILNVKSLQIIKIDPLEIIPKEYNTEIAYFVCFSPNENSKVLMAFGDYVKNETGKTVWGRSIFIVDIYTKEFTNITPSKFGKFGVNYPSGGVLRWTFAVVSKTDRLHLSDTLGEYIIQEDRFINTSKEQV